MKELSKYCKSSIKPPLSNKHLFSNKPPPSLLSPPQKCLEKNKPPGGGLIEDLQ